jgi:lipopolysaccharide transport system permease protein
VPLVLLSLSAGWLLSSLGVFVPDLRYAVPLVVQLVFFLTPIVYPAASVPERLRGALRLNPLASIVDNFRRVTLEGRPPLVGELAMWTALTAALVLAAYAWFMKTRRAFPDAL